MFVVIGKRHIFAGFFILLLCLLAVFSWADDKDSTVTLCTEHLKSIGLAPSAQPESVTTVEIPVIFDDIFTQYNTLQQAAGYDLSVFCGQSVTRYTFRLGKSEDILYANLLIYDGQIIGGEIINPRLDGYMLPLKELTYENRQISVTEPTGQSVGA